MTGDLKKAKNRPLMNSEVAEMTPLEALEEAEHYAKYDIDDSLNTKYVEALCQGYRAALAEIEVLKRGSAALVKNSLADPLVERFKHEALEARDEADRLAGLLEQALNDLQDARKESNK